MSELVWKGAPGNVIAQGGRGMYTIQSLTGSQYVLQAIDGEARDALGFFGLTFSTLAAAKGHAAAIEDAQ